MAQIIDINSQENQDNLIDRYLRNQMSAEEEAEFESSLRTDAALRNRARHIAQTIKALKSADEEQSSDEANYGYKMIAKNPLAKTKKEKK